jgi:hypothetical protein
VDTHIGDGGFALDRKVKPIEPAPRISKKAEVRETFDVDKIDTLYTKFWTACETTKAATYTHPIQYTCEGS